jgi:hypothetical protein
MSAVAVQPSFHAWQRVQERKAGLSRSLGARCSVVVGCCADRSGAESSGVPSWADVLASEQRRRS